jgi:hypothetical protein
MLAMVGAINLNSSVDHDENSECSEKTRTCRALWIHPMSESIMLDNLLIFMHVCYVFHGQLRNLGLNRNSTNLVNKYSRRVIREAQADGVKGKPCGFGDGFQLP